MRRRCIGSSTICGRSGRCPDRSSASSPTRTHSRSRSPTYAARQSRSASQTIRRANFSPLPSPPSGTRCASPPSRSPAGSRSDCARTPMSRLRLGDSQPRSSASSRGWDKRGPAGRRASTTQPEVPQPPERWRPVVVRGGSHHATGRALDPRFAPQRDGSRGTSGGTKLSESQRTSEHPIRPERHGAPDRTRYPSPRKRSLGGPASVQGSTRRR
jgi:hypothetical protein